MVLRQARGVTLIELMVAMVISALLVGGIYTLFLTQQRSYSVQDRVVGIQQDARAVLTMMVKDIRMAGFLVGAGSGSGFTVGGGSSPLLVRGTNRNYAVEFTNSSLAPDAIMVVHASEYVGEVQTVPASNRVTVDEEPTLLSANDYVTFDLHVGKVYQVSSVDNSANEITLTSNPDPAVSVGEWVYKVDAVSYGVDVAAGELERNGQPVAGGGVTTVVEDLQFAYQVDGDNAWYNGVPAGSTNADIRMVRINLIVRTAVADPEEDRFFKPACEDREQENTFTGCRRRVYATVVKVRNLGLF